MIVLIRGGGDLATGVAARLYRAGLKVLVTEIEQPLAVRRLVSFSEAIYQGETTVEGITAKKVVDYSDTLRMMNVWAKGQIPVVIDPDAAAIATMHPTIVVDARMLKQEVPLPGDRVNLLIGLGPGFTPGKNCHAAVETARGAYLGRLYWNSSPLADTGLPDSVLTKVAERVLRAPATGVLQAFVSIGEIVNSGTLVAQVGSVDLIANCQGLVRGMLRSGALVQEGQKIGDIDPRGDIALCKMISDKALAVAGGVIEAILSKPELRKNFWG